MVEEYILEAPLVVLLYGLFPLAGLPDVRLSSLGENYPGYFLEELIIFLPIFGFE
jgi:hypothetical protein